MRTASALALLLALSGCNPGVFDSLEDRASTRALSAPDGYVRGTFGTVLATVAAPVEGGAYVSRILATGGPNQPLATYSLWTGSEPSIKLTSATCDAPGDCPVSTGAAAAGIPSWADAGACFVVTAPDLAQTRIVCEGGVPAAMAPDDSVAGIELGRSIAGIPMAGNAIGVAILGAPGADDDAGALFRLEDGAALHTRMALPPELKLAAGDRLGDHMAVAALPSDTAATSLSAPVLLAVTASGADRVYLLAVGGENGDESELLGCVDGPEGFGGALALGDLTGEGEPELVIGQALEAPDRQEAAFIYPISGFIGARGCASADTSDDPVGETLECPSGLGATCEGSGFGSALAIGDVNADMLGDLLIGAPTATLGSATEAGAAFLFSGNLGGVDGAVAAEADLLADSQPKSGARAGTAVAMAESHLDVSAPARMEPVVSAPGARKLLVYLCTDLEQIASLANDRCLELD